MYINYILFLVHVYEMYFITIKTNMSIPRLYTYPYEVATQCYPSGLGVCVGRWGGGGGVTQNSDALVMSKVHSFPHNNVD